jgi:muramoyltetrapeptide carboxypeptidase LdcA involved in peptidoglycan recycling
MFGSEWVELDASDRFNKAAVLWEDPEVFTKDRLRESNEGWIRDGDGRSKGITWGGCLESIDEILRHGVAMPTLDHFASVVLISETSEESPTGAEVNRIYRALGERGILARIQGLLVGRPMSWSFSRDTTLEERRRYREEQMAKTVMIVRQYNADMPIVQKPRLRPHQPPYLSPLRRPRWDRWSAQVDRDGVLKIRYAVGQC